MIVTNLTQCISLAASRGIYIKDYDYKEGTTKEDYILNHPLIKYGRRFFNNPYYWQRLVDNKLYDVIDYLKGYKDFVPDVQIIGTFFLSKDPIFKDIIEEMIERLILHISNNPSKDMDEILFMFGSDEKCVSDCIKWIKFAKKNNIKPLYDTYGEIQNHYLFLLSIGYDSDELYNYLIEEGVDINKDDSMAYLTALRKQKYKIAWDLYKKGSDINSKNGIAKKLIQRKSNNTLEEEYRLKLTDLYNSSNDY